jgi:hypothetical protein
MGRLVSATSLVCVLAGCGLLLSCSSGSSTRVVPNPIPADVLLAPGPIASVEVGKTITLQASATNAAGSPLTETFSFQSSNPSVLTVASNGIACAGTWDSLTAPTVCTPGGTGTSQVTAEAGGVSSPPITVYVHQHITRVVIQAVPNQPPTLSTTCFSKGAPSGPERVLYEAFAYGGPNGTTDMTQTVGQFTWGQNGTAALVSFFQPPLGAPLNQQIAAAGDPGTTSIFASVAGVNSQPLPFTVCPVQSISFDVAGSPPSTTSFLLSAGATATVNATVKDSLGMTLTGVTLTWASTSPQAVSVAGAPSTLFGSVGTVSSASGGAASITASCRPPSCNAGIIPSMPIYPTNALTFQFTPGSTGAQDNPTVFATTSACAATTLSCTTRLVSITRSSSTTAFSAGALVNIPAAPNSFVFGVANSATGYLGVNSVGFGTQNAMIFSGGSVSPITGAAGRVLAVSPDANTVILSDTADSPNVVNICSNCSISARTVTPVIFPGASAATFSPDGLKAYVISGASCPGTSSAGCILVLSQVDAQQFVPLSVPPTDAAFIGNGSAGYLSQGSQTSFLPTCGPSTSASLGTASLPAQLLRPLADGMSLVALNPPDIQTVTAAISGAPPVNVSGCPAPRGALTISNTVGPSFNLGVGNFTPKEFFLSPDGSVAYILAQTAGGASLPFIISFDLNSDTARQISLAGGAVPLSAGISRSGTFLFVGADDNAVHVVDTTTGLDTQQIALTFPNQSLCIGPGNPATQVTIASLAISAAQQSGTNTTFTYSLANGSTPQTGQSLVLTGMADAGNNGTFTITAVNATSASSGTITVANAAGVTATSQSGQGTVPLSCNPDLVRSAP